MVKEHGNTQQKVFGGGVVGDMDEDFAYLPSPRPFLGLKWSPAIEAKQDPMVLLPMSSTCLLFAKKFS